MGFCGFGQNGFGLVLRIWNLGYVRFWFSIGWRELKLVVIGFGMKGLGICGPKIGDLV